MKAWTYKGFKAVIEFDSDDEIFVGRLLGINDVVGFHATTVKELKAAFHEAVDDYVTTCAKVGKAPEKEMSGNVMLRVEPQVHANAVMAARLSGKSLNQWAEEVLREASTAHISLTPAVETPADPKKTFEGQEASRGSGAMEAKVAKLGLDVYYLRLSILSDVDTRLLGGQITASEAAEWRRSLDEVGRVVNELGARMQPGQSDFGTAVERFETQKALEELARRPMRKS